jgi:hypothetical protein
MKHEAKSVPAKFEDGTDGEIVLQYPIREKDRCIIVGCAGTKDIVPWDDETAEFWGVNNLYGIPLKGQHYDRWFEIHNIWQDPRRNGKFVRRGAEDFRGQPILEYMQGIAKVGCTVYMQKHWPNLIPMSIPYPLDDVVNFFAARGIRHDICRYLTNSITYEIVLAICLGFKEIHVYGVDMAVGTEYESQRPSCEFWLGVAAGMGIGVYIPSAADLLKTRFIYGFEEKQQDVWREKIERVKKDMKIKRMQLEQRHKADEAAINQYIGGEQVVSEIAKIWANLGDDLMYQKRGS